MNEQLRLSDAIRLGAMLRPHGTGFLWWNGKSCALGAAGEAGGIEVVESMRHEAYLYEELRTMFPILRVISKCPACKHYIRDEPLHFVITCLSDSHGWTREQVADFAATVEAAQPSSADQAQVSQIPELATATGSGESL